MPVEGHIRGKHKFLKTVKYLKLRERPFEILFVPCDDRHVGTSLREENSQ